MIFAYYFFVYFVKKHLLLENVCGKICLSGDKIKAKGIKGSGYEKVAQNAWKYGNQFNAFVMEGQPADVWEQTEKMNDEARKSPALGFVPDVSGLNAEIANISNVQAEFKAKKSCGTSPVDEWYDDYVAKLKTAGIEKVRDEI